MPVDFLLPLFVVTLVANAFLVAFAIRGMRRGQPDDDRSMWADRPSTATSLDHAAPSRTEHAVVETAVEPAAPPEPPSSVDPEPAAPAGPSVQPTGEPASEPPADDTVTAGEPAPVGPPKRRRAKAGGDAQAARSRPTEPRRGRRRFSLPPLDDDHEKVNRSIESFLGGVDASGGGPIGPVGPVGPEPATAGIQASRPAAPDPATGATTVALIAVEGVTDIREAGHGSPGSRAASRDALAMVERTLRGAARGTDLVTVGRRGRFRIVLHATGELAARAYLRRIRAAIEPALEASDPSLRLTVATATVLDEPLDLAVHRAEDRLALALDAARQTREATEDQADMRPDDEQRAPRAAAD